VTDLQRRLKRLVKMRPDVFGAEGHDFELNPPLAETTVAARGVTRWMKP